MNSRCVEGATVTPLTSALVWGREIVFRSLNSWSMSYTEVTPSCTTYSRWETPVEALTTALCEELAGSPEPPSFFAVSSTLIVCPTSPATGTYVWLLAPEIGRQPLPVFSHCSHW